MAILKITGTVASINDGQFPNMKIWESYQFKGSEKFRLWTCWLGAAAQVGEGDLVEVEGELSTKVSSYIPKNETEPRSIVEHHLNDTTYRLLTAKNADFVTEPTTSVVEEIDLPF